MSTNPPFIKTGLDELTLVGITARTSNALELSADTAQIGPTLQKYFQQGLAQQILSRTTPGTTYCVYTAYESDENGMYTYFVGEQVSEPGVLPQGFSTITIPAQTYHKFELGPGQMPDICINAWQKIWGMNTTEIGGKRSYIADFEIYDERAQNPQETCLDIYIGMD